MARHRRPRHGAGRRLRRPRRRPRRPRLGRRDAPAQPGRRAHRLGARPARRPPHGHRRQRRRPPHAAREGRPGHRRDRPHDRGRRRGQQDRHLPEGAGRARLRRSRSTSPPPRLRSTGRSPAPPTPSRSRSATAEEVATVSGATASGEAARVRVVAPGSPVANPGFDVTPARLVTGIVTERGVAPASREGLARLFPERAGGAAARGPEPAMTPAAGAPGAGRHRPLADGARPLCGHLGQRLGARGRGSLDHPDGIACDELDAASIVELGLDGAGARPARARRASGASTATSTARRPEVGAVVHTHSTFATAYSCLRRPLPAFHYMVAKAGGTAIRCARYATYGTEALSRNALARWRGTPRLPARQPRLLALGADLVAARSSPRRSRCSRAQYAAARAMGRPVILPATRDARGPRRSSRATASRRAADQGAWTASTEMRRPAAPTVMR